MILNTRQWTSFLILVFIATQTKCDVSTKHQHTPLLFWQCLSLQFMCISYNSRSLQNTWSSYATESNCTQLGDFSRKKRRTFFILICSSCRIVRFTISFVKTHLQEKSSKNTWVSKILEKTELFRLSLRTLFPIKFTSKVFCDRGSVRFLQRQVFM